MVTQFKMLEFLLQKNHCPRSHMTYNSEGEKGSGWALSSIINYGQRCGNLAVSDKSENTRALNKLSIKTKTKAKTLSSQSRGLGPIPSQGTGSCMCSVASDSATSRATARQAPLSMGFSRQEDWSGLPFPTPGNKTQQNQLISQ